MDICIMTDYDNHIWDKAYRIPIPPTANYAMPLMMAPGYGELLS
jgi:hypothetical protein